jgi:hypothetical protein
MMQDADAIVADYRDLIERHNLDKDTARNVIVNAMLGDQPLPLIEASVGSAHDADKPRPSNQDPIRELA